MHIVLSVLCIVCTLYCLYLILYVPCIVCTLHCLYFVVYVLCSQCTLYCLYLVLSVPCIVCTLYCMYLALSVLCIVCTLYCLYPEFSLPVCPAYRTVTLVMTSRDTLQSIYTVLCAIYRLYFAAKLHHLLHPSFHSVYEQTEYICRDCGKGWPLYYDQYLTRYCPWQEFKVSSASTQCVLFPVEPLVKSDLRNEIEDSCNSCSPHLLHIPSNKPRVNSRHSIWVCVRVWEI